MKTSFLSAALLLTLGLLTAVPFRSYAQEEAAIKAVIAAETKAFFDRDYPAWAAQWLQSEHDAQSWNNRAGDIYYSRGWDKVGSGAKAWIASQPKPQTPPTIDRTEWHFQINGDMAAVSFLQTFNDGKEIGTSREFRVMVRQNGQWKISGMQAFWDYKNVKKI